MPEKIIEIISALLVFILIFGLIYAIMAFLIRKNFRKLQREFGGELTFKNLKADYSLKDISVSYILGSPYSVGGTIFRVAKLPKASIQVSLATNKTFFNAQNQFWHAFDSDNVELNDYKSLSVEIEKFISEMKSNKSCLTINSKEFSLATEYSPFYYQKIKNCLSQLLRLKKTIKQQERASGRSAL